MEKRRNTIHGYDEKDNTENNENLLKLKNLKESCQSNVLKDFMDDYLISGFKNEFIDVDMIIKEIDNILANGIYKSYKHNIDKFFKINDSNNNYRIYRGVKMI